MKKHLPAIITFLIVWIIGFGVLWLAEITTGLHNMPRWVYYTVIGLIGVLIGWLGPKISDPASSGNSKNPDSGLTATSCA